MNTHRSTRDAVVDHTGRLALVLPVLTAPVLATLGLLDRARHRLRTHDDPNGELGASVVEWVLILAAVITIVAAVAVVITQKLTSKANQLDLSTP